MAVKKGKLTIKQTKFVKEYVKTDGNGTEAALSSYDTKDYATAAAISSENLNKPLVKEAIELALLKHEITIESAIQPIADGLKAVKSFPVAEGVTVDTVDHSTRLKASGMALKLLGAEKQEGAVPQSVHFHNHQADQRDKYDL